MFPSIIKQLESPGLSMAMHLMAGMLSDSNPVNNSASYGRKGCIIRRRSNKRIKREGYKWIGMKLHLYSKTFSLWPNKKQDTFSKGF
jgi:hypothetical protein